MGVVSRLLALRGRKRLAPSVNFHFRQPELPNLGDVLCSPRHYFTFTADSHVTILGGGAFNGLGVNAAQRLRTEKRVAWGVGQSWRFEEKPKALPINKISRVYDVASTRDPSSHADGIALVPCVSVLHPIVDIEPGKEQALFLNHDPEASGNTDSLLSRYKDDGIIVASNALTELDFISAFTKAGDITTNSYHAAYWGLLSGRSVRLVGYSSKFHELLRLFGFGPDNVISYQRGSSGSLASALAIARDRLPLRVSDHRKYRTEFRDLNLDFAASLERIGVSANPVGRTTTQRDTTKIREAPF